MCSFVLDSFHLSILLLRCIHVGVLQSFLIINDAPLCDYSKFYLFIHRSFNGYLSCFHSLAILSNVAMNIHVHIFMWTYPWFSLDYIRRNGFAMSCSNFMFNFSKNCQTVFQMPAQFYISVSIVWGFQFLPILANTY